MERWTRERLENMDDFEFAAMILGERRAKTRAYTQLDTKLGNAMKLLLDIAEQRRAGETRNCAEPARMMLILNNALNHLSDGESGEELYETLSERLFMFDEEIAKAGFAHLLRKEGSDESE